MNHIDHVDHDIHALVDQQLDDAGMREALERLASDTDATARCAAYAAQREGLMALRDGLSLSLPSPSLAAMTQELGAMVRWQEQMHLAMAVGSVMALMGIVGYASLADREVEH